MAIRELDRVLLVDRQQLRLASRRIVPVWADEAHVVVGAESAPDRSLVATTHLVYAPEGARVEIVPETPTPDTIAANPTARPQWPAAQP